MKKMLVLAGALAAFGFSAHATTIANFGDSLSDSGNIQTVLASGGGTLPPIYPNGQFTNGDTWATQLGLAPSLLGGTNYAYGGATAVENGDTIPDLLSQIGSFLGGGASADIATIWVGGNDFLVLPDNPTLTEISNTISNVVSTISLGVSALALSGIDEIVVFGLPDFGLLPGNASDPLAAGQASLLTGIYNSILEGTLDFLDQALTASVSFFDTNSVFQEVIGMVPEPLISVPCLADPVGCAAAPEDYVFYDNIHPSEWVHTLFAEAVAKELGLSGPSEVPLPASAPLLLAGLGGLALWTRRRRSPAQALRSQFGVPNQRVST